MPIRELELPLWSDRGTIIRERLWTDDDGFGFVVKWRVDRCWCDVVVWNIDIVNEDGSIEFMNHEPPVDVVSDVADAEVYGYGYVKWDGCHEIDYGCPHFCGATFLEKHVALMRWLFWRAGKLMVDADHQEFGTLADPGLRHEPY